MLKKLIKRFIAILFIAFCSHSFVLGKSSLNAEEFEIAKKSFSDENVLVRYLEKENTLKTESLQLYKFFKMIEQEIDNVYKVTFELYKHENVNEENKLKLEPCLAKLKKDKETVEYTLTAFAAIVDILNKGGYPELRIKFGNLCNYFNESVFIEWPTLRELRAFEEKIDKFNNYLKRQHEKMHYYFKKNDNASFYSQLMEFTLYVRKNLNPWKEYLHINLADRLTDTFFFHPYEWMEKNPILTTLIAVTIATGIGYFYVWPKYQLWSLRNLNSKYDIEQFHVLQQKGLRCGAHALYNLKCLKEAKDEEDLKTRLNNAYDFQNFIQQCDEYLEKYGETTENLGFDHIDGLAGALGINMDSVLLAPNIDSLKKGNHQPTIPDNWRIGIREGESKEDFDRRDGETYAKVKNNPNDYELSNGKTKEERVREFYVKGRASYTSDIIFRRGNPLETVQNVLDRYQNEVVNALYFIVNTASLPQSQAGEGFRSAAKRGYGHWITYKVEHDKNAKQGMRIIALNSTNSNITNNRAIERITTLLN